MQPVPSLIQYEAGAGSMLDLEVGGVLGRCNHATAVL